MRTSIRRPLFLVLVACAVHLSCGGPCRAQLTTSEEERLQILSDPEAIKKAAAKDKSRAPFEFFRSQVAPFDVLPLIKPYQWNTVILELRANYANYDGLIQTLPVSLSGMPREMIYGREARLVKEQRSRQSIQLMVPRVPREKELGVELVQPGAIRADELWQVPIRLLPPYQMLVVVLSKESANQYVHWNRLAALLPGTADREDPMALDLQRYFRMVLPEEPDKPFLSPHPLTWAPISHIVWDGLPPDSLSVSHQQAMLDWLHWGGQIVIVGGAGPTYSVFRDSFLGPYLPAEPIAESASLGDAELRPLAEAYPPVVQQVPAGDQDQPAAQRGFNLTALGIGPYQRPVPIHTPPTRPLVVSGLKPLPGSKIIPLGEGSPHLLAVENRVGRGRITMLTVNLNDPALVAWPGLDTLVRRVVLRRPEEQKGGPYATVEAGGSSGPRPTLEAHDLSWYRITSRDAGAELEALRSQSRQTMKEIEARRGRPPVQTAPAAPAGDGLTSQAEEAASRRLGVAEWRDTTTLPRLSRDLLERASGITVPGTPFVLKVILSYMLAVVPLNWLFCRVLLRRREWAWIIVPLLALGFAVGVERVAAYDLGYDSACDEIDLLEVHGGYSRAHLSRFASLYTTARTRYTIAYSTDPTALALPFNNERSIGGEEVTTAVWQSYPVAALRGLAIQPRSLAMFRAEQMLNLSGSIRLDDRDGKRTLVNESDLELHDAVLVDYPVNGRRNERSLGDITPRSVLDLASLAPQPASVGGASFDGPNPIPFLEALRREREGRPENQGELRLVAWIPRPVDGQTFEPALDRHRGLTAVLVHLRYGEPPSPDGPRYNLLAEQVESPTVAAEGGDGPAHTGLPSTDGPHEGPIGGGVTRDKR